MKSARTVHIISILLSLASVIICCIVPYAKAPGIVVPLSVINLLSGDGKLHINDTLGYFGALLCFILPIIFIFVTSFAKIKTIKAISFFLLLPIILGSFNPIFFTYLFFAIIQIIIWANVKNQ